MRFANASELTFVAYALHSRRRDGVFSNRSDLRRPQNCGKVLHFLRCDVVRCLRLTRSSSEGHRIRSRRGRSHWVLRRDPYHRHPKDRTSCADRPCHRRRTVRNSPGSRERVLARAHRPHRLHSRVAVVGNPETEFSLRDSTSMTSRKRQEMP